MRVVSPISILVCLVVAFLASTESLPAESLGDFFKKLGNSIAHPQNHPSPSRNRGAKGKPGETPTPTPTPGASVTPEPVVRTASVVSGPVNSKQDIPYGIPVAKKPGFVSSPYSPDQGVVDVRGIPSGTEVKDPFTGKVFLTP